MLFVVSVIPFNSAVVKMGLQTAANCLRLDRLTGSRSAPKGEQRIRVPDWESGTCILQTCRLLGSIQKVGSEGFAFPRVYKASVGSIITSL